jgi:hypothetical protein
LNVIAAPGQLNRSAFSSHNEVAMKATLKILIAIVLASPIAANAQFRPAKCEVQPLWIGGGVRSANFGLMGTFEKDGREGELIRSFKLDGTQLVATAAIDYQSEYSKNKPRPFEIRLAVTVADRERTEIFESVDSSEAKTRYLKGWNLSVTKNISFDNRVYMFTLRCWDSTAFAGRPLL